MYLLDATLSIHNFRSRRPEALTAILVVTRRRLTRLNSVIVHQRPFVTAPDYFGPDRRRKTLTFYAGPMRRTSDRSEVLEL